MNGEHLLTPPASAASPSPSTASTLTRISHNLPVQRKHALLAGSTKEIKLIHYLDDQLERVYRRYEKRLVAGQREPAPPSKHDDAPGYESMDQVIEDLDPLIDVVWTTRTRKSSRISQQAEQQIRGSYGRVVVGTAQECWWATPETLSDHRHMCILTLSSHS
jgi:hypothetical protein